MVAWRVSGKNPGLTPQKAVRSSGVKAMRHSSCSGRETKPGANTSGVRGAEATADVATPSDSAASTSGRRRKDDDMTDSSRDVAEEWKSSPPWPKRYACRAALSGKRG